MRGVCSEEGRTAMRGGGHRSGGGGTAMVGGTAMGVGWGGHCMDPGVVWGYHEGAVWVPSFGVILGHY